LAQVSVAEKVGVFQKIIEGPRVHNMVCNMHKPRGETGGQQPLADPDSQGAGARQGDATAGG